MNSFQNTPRYTVVELDSDPDKEVHMLGPKGKESTKVRNLRKFEVSFPKGHKNVFDEVAMQKQGYYLKAPLFHQEANEDLPDSYPEGYIGLVRGEFVKSNAPLPVFK